MEQIKKTIESQLKSIGALKADQKIKSIEAIHGGSINESFRIDAEGLTFFLKINKRKDAIDFFELEAKGLELLRINSRFHIPKVLSIFSVEKFGGLLMEFIPKAKPSSNFWEDFGEKLAELHKVRNHQFGLEYDNYIGSLLQSNQQTDHWVDFFMEQRLEKQYQLSINNKLLDSSFGKDLERIYKKLPDLIPTESPSLLHGDLWSGNFAVSSKGSASIFDPAVYFGHREVDIAMMHLFGGFDNRLFDAYNEVYPLEKSWESRIDLFNLYPLMVHVNLFGGSYVSRLRQVMKRYT